MQKEDFNEIINLLKQYGPEYVYNLITTNNTSYPSIQNIQQFTGGASQAINMIKDIHQDYIDFKEGGFKFKKIKESLRSPKKTYKKYKIKQLDKYKKTSSSKLEQHEISKEGKYSPIKSEYNILTNEPYSKLSKKNFLLLTKNIKVINGIPYVKMYYLDIKKIAKELSKIQKGGDDSGDSISIGSGETFDPLPENLQEGGFFSFYLNKYTVTLDRLEKYSKDIQDWKWFEMNIKFLAGKTDTVKTKENQDGGNNEYSEYEQYGGKIQMSDYSSDGNPNIDSNFLTSYTLSNYSSNSSPSLELTLSSDDDLLVSEL